MTTRMQQRRGTAAQWVSLNTGNGPRLASGEIGYETDTGKFKIGDGINYWIDLEYFVDEASLATSLGEYISSDLLGANNGVAQLNSSGKLVSTQIPNIDELTMDAIDSALIAGTGLDKTYDDNGNTITLDIDSTVATKTYADTAVSTHSSDTTSVHGITDTAELATKTFAAELLTNATKTNITITGDKNGLTITAENGVADSTTDNLTEGSTNKYFTDERAQDAIGNILGTGLSYNDAAPGIGINNAVLTDYLLDGVSGSSYGLIGTSEYLDIKATNGYNKEIELDIASVETKLETDGFAKLADTTFTGDTVVDNLEIGGTLTFSGTATEISSTNTVIEDPLIYLADGNPGNINDLGFVANYNDGTYAHTGLVKDASAGKWKLFKGVTDEPTTTVNFAQGSLDDLEVSGLTATSITVGDVSNTEFGYLNGVTSAIQTQLDDKAPLASPTFTGTVTVPNGAALGTPASATLTNATDLPLGTGVTGTLPIANGGTGATTASTAAAALLPSQSSNSGKYLTTDGSGTLSWGTVSGYSAPTLGSTSIASGATVTTVAGLTLTAPIITTSVNAQTGTTYTTVLSDASALVTLNNASAITVSIPTNASVAYAVGTVINFAWVTGAGQPTIQAATAGTTTILSTASTSTAPKLRVANSMASAVKIATDTWLVTGDLS